MISSPLVEYLEYIFLFCGEHWVVWVALDLFCFEFCPFVLWLFCGTHFGIFSIELLASLSSGWTFWVSSEVIDSATPVTFLPRFAFIITLYFFLSCSLLPSSFLWKMDFFRCVFSHCHHLLFNSLTLCARESPSSRSLHLTCWDIRLSNMVSQIWISVSSPKLSPAFASPSRELLHHSTILFTHLKETPAHKCCFYSRHEVGQCHGCRTVVCCSPFVWLSEKHILHV